jgi:hypothetical protein
MAYGPRDSVAWAVALRAGVAACLLARERPPGNPPMAYGPRDSVGWAVVCGRAWRPACLPGGAAPDSASVRAPLLS